ncbi:hypothetical protein [Thalassotalea profundi]|uniref:DUF4242 domain-containing protein n=1 Tax=Thalassotalea profundi TaxID=2036687 RepID=A0ABQ3J4C2_9GAMM|nr:hypothetical protein [Thalassotalea profundi]GHF02950.1 hypothetical protein GCM10011501_35250 [Thalassotalea profundi]
MSKYRFFYAKESHKTWPKLFVLSNDGVLYCEYLDHYNPTVFKEQVEYSTFDADKFKWNGYQTIVEIDRNTAVETKLTKQPNWVLNYINQ